MSEKWWESFPARYESELEELERAGFRYNVDEEARRAGHLRINVFPIIDGRELRVVALFPALYPFFRFEVQAPTENLAYHQHPFAKTLCLIPRDTGWWHPESDRLAFLLRDRLASVLRTGNANSADGDVVEDEQAEPFTDYYPYPAGPIVLIDGAWSVPPEAEHGELVLGAESPPGERPPPFLRAALLEIRDHSGNVLHKATEEIAKRYSVRLTGRWVNLPAAPMIDKPDCLFAKLAEGNRATSKHLANKVQGGTLTIRAAVFPEEHRWRGTEGDTSGQGWLFSCCFSQVAGKSITAQRSKHERRHGRFTQPQQNIRNCYFARAGRVGRQDLLARAPELSSLANKTITVFGLGCIGAPSTLEFARAGIGELRIVDHDVVDPATIIRWPRGLTAAGHLKTHVLEQVITSDYPMTVVKTNPLRLGAVTEGRADDWGIVAEMLSETSLVYDATAEPGVQYFLAEAARARGLPFISVSGTQGGWGGVLVRIRPQKTKGCWLCYRFAQDSGDLPSPPHDQSNGRVQPEGCADPTYTGSGFDLGELSLGGVRLAVSTLSSGEENGYPQMDWDIAVLSLRDENGRAITPTWTTHEINPHPLCPSCRTN